MKTAAIVFSTIAPLCLMSCIGTGRVNDAVEEMKLKAVTVENVDNADSSLDGSVIFATGTTSVSDMLTDDTYGISVKALRLVRSVEYYQMKEQSSTTTRKNDKGQTESVTTYTYVPEWSSTKVNSSFFNDEDYKNVNVVSVDIDDRAIESTSAHFGAYELSAEVLSNLPTSESVEVKKAPEGAHVVDGKQIYYGKDPASPQVGDVRVSFSIAPVSTISVMALVKGKTLVNYTATNGMSIAFAKPGKVGISDIVNTGDIIELSANDALRSVGKAITKELKL